MDVVVKWRLLVCAISLLVMLVGMVLTAGWRRSAAVDQTDIRGLGTARLGSVGSCLCLASRVVPLPGAA